MALEMLQVAWEAAIIMVDPVRMGFLIAGVLIGLGLGVIPGLGGIVGMALLLPFTFDMDAYTAFAFLLGMGSVTTTSDTIPAVLFGVPGTAGSAATILDGHPLARQGQAGRAFGAAYTASMLGGVFGALLLAVSIPILRPVMLKVGAPELLSFTIFGLCMVAVLSGGSPLRGLAAAGLGLMINMIGSDPQTGTLRWTLGQLYLWDGLPLVPVTLGIFALPELADMAIARRSIAVDDKNMDSRTGQWEGVKDTFRHWWLVVRCAWLGASLGAVPGLGAAVIDWIAYGHAARSEEGAEKTFGKGDIRGVLASEGANNAKEGGALVPTIAFGVPGSASMAILLGAFLIHGLVPGPEMLREKLDVTYAIVWSVAFANIFGAGICFLFSNQLAKIALIRFSIIMPMILTVIMIGAFQARRDWGDLIAVTVRIIGLMINMIGSDPQTGTLRWTLGQLYLWDGLPLVPVTLGIFALPELADMAIARRSIAVDDKNMDSRTGQWEGVKDTFRHWWLVVRCAWLGASLGAVPGLGAAVIDWIAYGHAARSEEGAEKTFGKGDIRGVLASEGANNAKEGGALVPTIAFGVPGSASMAILLGAFLIHGLVPGPEMLREKLDVTYAIVWSVAFANIFGAGICFLFSNQLAKIALIRFSIIMPMILTVIMIGAFQARRDWGDLIAVILFGILGWVMKRLKWPRPPIILGVVLGHLVERYVNISYERYGEWWIFQSGRLFGRDDYGDFIQYIYFDIDWAAINYIVIVIFTMSAWGLLRPFMKQIGRAGGFAGMFGGFRAEAKFDLNSVFYIFLIGLLAIMLFDSLDWKPLAKRVPIFVGYITICVAIISFLTHTFHSGVGGGGAGGAERDTREALHLDIEVDDDDVDSYVMRRRALAFLGWLIGFVLVTAVFGMLPTIFVFVIAYMRLEADEPMGITLTCATGLTVFSYFLFDYLLALPWPRPLLGIWFPVLGNYIPSLG